MSSPIFLSIVVPVYNTQRYLKRCLNSIFNQKPAFAFEVVAVNDCSEDRSSEILEEYARIMPNLRVCNHPQNRRLSEARKTGILQSNGTYIMQVDSDDWVPENALNRIFEILSAHPVDVLVHNYYTENAAGRVSSRSWIKQTRTTDDKRELRKYFVGAPWSKIARRELVSNSVTDDRGINHGEDVVYCAELYLRARTFRTVCDTLYTYCANEQSLTSRMTTRDLLSNQLIITKALEKIIDQYKPSSEQTYFLAEHLLRFLAAEVFQLHYSVNTEANDREAIRLQIEEIGSSPLFTSKQQARLLRALRRSVWSVAEVMRTGNFQDSSKLFADVFRRYLRKYK
jgi:glycosyltransferase involved in cell wall biosynthesis